MAPRSSARTKHARQNSEEIEDARPTQNGHMEDVSDDDQPRAARVKKEKKGKGKQRAPAPPDDDADEEDDLDLEDSDDEDRIDVENFPDQPLISETQLPKLKGLSDDWDAMRKMINQRCDIYKDVAAAMAEAGETDVKTSESLAKLDQGIKEFIDVGEEMKAHSEALNAIHSKVAHGDRVSNALAMYEEEVTQRVDAYAVKSARQKYAKDERYYEFHSTIWEIAHPDEGMPPITNLIEKEDNDDSDSDEEIQVGGVTQNFHCPITLTILKDPYTSSVCKHSFSKDSIKELCGRERGPIKCPASGCNKKFKFSDCHPDETLARKVRAYDRRQKQRLDNSDAEEGKSDDAEEVMDED